METIGWIWERNGKLLIECDENMGMIIMPDNATIAAVLNRTVQGKHYDGDMPSRKNGWLVVGGWSRTPSETVVVFPGYTHNGTFAEWAMEPKLMPAFGLTRNDYENNPRDYADAVRVSWGG